MLEWVDEQTLYLTTMMEGRISARNFLLSLGNQCQLVSPQDLKQEIHAIAKDMLRFYIPNFSYIWYNFTWRVS